MATITKKSKASTKDPAAVAEVEVGVLLAGVGLDVSAPSAGGLLLSPPNQVVEQPSSSSSSSSSSASSTTRIFTDATRRAEEMVVLKRKLSQREDQACAASAVLPVAVAPALNLAMPNALVGLHQEHGGSQSKRGSGG